MRYRLLGRSGLRVSELWLGAMTFGEDWGWGAPEASCRRMLDLYLDRGGNVVDTADWYTNAPTIRTAAATTAGGWSRRWTGRSAVCAPTGSTCSGCTSSTS